MNDYFSFTDILASQERVPSVTLSPLTGCAFLDPSNAQAEDTHDDSADDSMFVEDEDEHSGAPKTDLKKGKSSDEILNVEILHSSLKAPSSKFPCG